MIKNTATVLFITITLFCMGIMINLYASPKKEAAPPPISDEAEGKESISPPPEITAPPENAAQNTGDLMPRLCAADGKNAYLTFDDGPSINTPAILDILEKYNAPATFFVIGTNAERYPDYVRQEWQQGHTVANHSYAHNYKSIYAGKEPFRADIIKAQAVIDNILGAENAVKLYRFPGGSYGRTRLEFGGTLTNMGYAYVDWNVTNGDADGKKLTAARCLQTVKDGSRGHGNIVILMHDTGSKSITVQSLPSILEYLTDEGYTFRAIIP